MNINQVILGSRAEAVFHRGQRNMHSLTLDEGNTPGFKKIGRADHGFMVERSGDLYLISSQRLRSSGYYRSAVLARKTSDGKFRIVAKDKAEEMLPLLETAAWKAPKAFKGKLGANVDIQINTNTTIQ